MSRIQPSVCLCAALAAIAGCGGGQKAVVEDPNVLPYVQCKVQLNGKDIEWAVIGLHSAGGGKSTEVTGQYDDDSSSYRFITKEGTTKRGGVPEGDYIVTVKTGQKTNTKIPAKYANPTTSGIKATIKKGNNYLEPIELES